MKLSYGEGFDQLLDGLRQVMEYSNEHFGVTTAYFGMGYGDNRVVCFMADFEDHAALAAWSEKISQDQGYWELVGRVVAPVMHRIVDDEVEVLRTL
jgi:hypothetical protein